MRHVDTASGCAVGTDGLGVAPLQTTWEGQGQHRVSRNGIWFGTYLSCLNRRRRLSPRSHTLSHPRHPAKSVLRAELCTRHGFVLVCGRREQCALAKRAIEELRTATFGAEQHVSVTATHLLDATAHRHAVRSGGGSASPELRLT